MKLCGIVTKLMQKYRKSDISKYKSAVVIQDKFLKTIQRVIIALSLFLWLIHISKPVIVDESIVVYETALPDSNIICAVILLLQYYFTCIQLMAVLITNFAYLLLCAYLILLVRTLRRNLTRIINSNRDFVREEICGCVIDHQALLS